MSTGYIQFSAEQQGAIVAEVGNEVGVDDYIRVVGDEFYRSGEPFYPVGFNCIGLVRPAWCSDSLSAALAAEAAFNTTTWSVWESYGVNTVRFQISHPGVAGNGTITQSDIDTYIAYVLDGVQQLREFGFIVIVSCQDQHRACGDSASTPWSRTITFWETLAPLLAHDLGVMFELYNEPQTNTAQQVQWRDGGGLNDIGQTRVGHQALLDTVRDAGARNVVLASGGGFGHTLAGTTALVDPLNNYGYTIHPYDFATLGGASSWETPYATAQAIAPIVATEWSAACDGVENVLAPYFLDWMQAQNIGVLAHAGDLLDSTFVDFTGYVLTECGTANAGKGRIFTDWMGEL